MRFDYAECYYACHFEEWKLVRSFSDKQWSLLEIRISLKQSILFHSINFTQPCQVFVISLGFQFWIVLYLSSFYSNQKSSIIDYKILFLLLMEVMLNNCVLVSLVFGCRSQTVWILLKLLLLHSAKCFGYCSKYELVFCVLSCTKITMLANCQVFFGQNVGTEDCDFVSALSGTNHPFCWVVKTNSDFGTQQTTSFICIYIIDWGVILVFYSFNFLD